MTIFLTASLNSLQRGQNHLDAPDIFSSFENFLKQSYDNQEVIQHVTLFGDKICHFTKNVKNTIILSRNEKKNSAENLNTVDYGKN